MCSPQLSQEQMQNLSSLILTALIEPEAKVEFKENRRVNRS